MKFVSLLSALVLASGVSFAQLSVDTADTVQIGGLRQYITIKGTDPSLPLLLFLHGGPGGSVMHYADRFTDRLQRHFLVVQWDQRQTGKTLHLNTSTAPLSLKLFQEDARALIDTLLRRFDRKKIYLAAHSWGTALGFHIAENNPGALYAYIAIGPMIHQRESEKLALTKMRDLAIKNGDRVAEQQLSSVNIPFGNGEQLYYHRTWLHQMPGSRKNLSKEYVEEWARTWLQTYNEACEQNLFETLPEIRCPVYFFSGRTDYQTNASITYKYYSMVKAPRKGFFWFERSGHAIPSSEPARMQSIIVDLILPETFIIQPETLISDQ